MSWRLGRINAERGDGGPKRDGETPDLIEAVERRPRTALAAFLALHGVVWTALPALFFFNLPLDVIEAMVYGREWQIGYDDLPPLPWWLAEIVWRVFGTDASLYALSPGEVMSRSSRSGRRRARWSARPARLPPA